VIDSLRAVNNLSLFAWTDLTLTPGETPFKAVHLLELRTALNEVYQVLGKPLPTYTNTTIVARQTVLGALDIDELRSAVQALQ
jgi:hypothetical protein